MRGRIDNNPLWIDEARFYRTALRSIASSTNERTAIACLLSPGAVAGNSVALERHPHSTPRAEALFITAVGNSFVFDWCLRITNSSNVSLFLLQNIPLPTVTPTIKTLLAHGALRLTSLHSGYAALWREQVGTLWRETRERETWPALQTGELIMGLKAAIDAAVARSYGISERAYSQVLASFNHSAQPSFPVLCLERFAEFGRIGPEEYARKYDSYWDIPLNESLPVPVIEFPGFAAADERVSGFSLASPYATKKGRRRK